MGLFQNKKSPDEEVLDEVKALFDDTFREELRGRARQYFDSIINENAALFKQDLDATLIQVYTELKKELADKLDEQFDKYSGEMKEAQNTAIKSLNRSVQALQEQHQQVSASLQKNATDQETITLNAYEENRARMIEMKDAQDLAVQSLNSSVEALKQEHEQLSASIKKSAADQQALLVDVFEKNMAQVVEHYLLGALGDKFDLKAQLPLIIQQMEENKQDIVDDMKL